MESTTQASTYRRRRLSERNKTYTLILCTPAPRMWLLLPIHLALLILEGIILTIVRNDEKIWKEIYFNVPKSLAANISMLRSVRNEIQKLRAGRSVGYQKNFTMLPQKLRLLYTHGWPVIR